MKNLLIISLFIVSTALHAHCQLPCGIYHDDLEFQQLEECIQTLHRANKGILINDLTTPLGDNQMVRCVNLKDQYADKVSHIFSFYFLQQRIQQNQPNTIKLLTLSHQILQTAMKVKQTVDQSVVSDLQSQILKFKEIYESSKAHD
ncbi:MAG: hypothetical protein S4CHLAM7_13390 [Chlamydiae bacterium]|nr:hypothetical protein [Chlamydiota bacterium]